MTDIFQVHCTVLQFHIMKLVNFKFGDLILLTATRFYAGIDKVTHICRLHLLIGFLLKHATFSNPFQAFCRPLCRPYGVRIEVGAPFSVSVWGKKVRVGGSNHTRKLVATKLDVLQKKSPH